MSALLALWRDSLATKRRKLTAVLSPVTRDATDLALLSDLLSIPCGEVESIKEITPQQKIDRTFDALLRSLDASATRQPALMVFEDLHWADPTSLELLDRIVAYIECLPVLLIATSRPEFHPHWVGQAHVTMLVLPRLGPREGAALVHALAGAAEALPAKLVDEIIKRSDGVPLFIEELTKSVVESAEQADDRATALTVPTTLQASLMARLDRLPLARRVAQVAAASAVISRMRCLLRPRGCPTTN